MSRVSCRRPHLAGQRRRQCARPAALRARAHRSLAPACLWGPPAADLKLELCVGCALGSLRLVHCQRRTCRGLKKLPRPMNEPCGSARLRYCTVGHSVQDSRRNAPACRPQTSALRPGACRAGERAGPLRVHWLPFPTPASLMASGTHRPAHKQGFCCSSLHKLPCRSASYTTLHNSTQDSNRRNNDLVLVRPQVQQKLGRCARDAITNKQACAGSLFPSLAQPCASTHAQAKAVGVPTC